MLLLLSFFVGARTGCAVKFVSGNIRTKWKGHAIGSKREGPARFVPRWYDKRHAQTKHRKNNKLLTSFSIFTMVSRLSLLKVPYLHQNMFYYSNLKKSILIPSFPHSLILSFPHSLIPSFPHSLIPSFPHFLNSTFPHFLLSSFPPSLLSPFPHFPISSFPHFRASSFPHFLIFSCPHYLHHIQASMRLKCPMLLPLQTHPLLLTLSNQPPLTTTSTFNLSTFCFPILQTRPILSFSWAFLAHYQPLYPKLASAPFHPPHFSHNANSSTQFPKRIHAPPRLCPPGYPAATKDGSPPHIAVPPQATAFLSTQVYFSSFSWYTPACYPTRLWGL